MTKPFENRKDFENIFKEYFNPLVNFVNKYLNNYENSREVVQLTFVKIWENRHNLEVKSSVKSYIYQITKNAMIDYVRKNSKHFKSVDLEKSLAENIEETSDSLLDPYIVRHAVDTCTQDLKPKAKQIFELHKYEGLTYSEIADYMDISKRSVEDNVSKVLKYLKERLKDHRELFE